MLSHIEELEQKAEVAAALAIFGDRATAGDVGPKLTCSEAEALAIILRAVDAAEVADVWLDGHAMGDDEEDEHYQRGEKLAGRG